MLSLFICVRLFAAPWTVASQAPLSMGFSRQEYWSGLPECRKEFAYLIMSHTDSLLCSKFVHSFPYTWGQVQILPHCLQRSGFSSLISCHTPSLGPQHPSDTFPWSLCCPHRLLPAPHPLTYLDCLPPLTAPSCSFFLFIFLTALGLPCCAWVFSSCRVGATLKLRWFLWL